MSATNLPQLNETPLLPFGEPQSNIGRSRRGDPSTSRDAARRMNPDSLQAQIVRTLQASKNGLTIEEITLGLGRKEVSVSPRLRELERKGFIYRSGRRANISGLEAIVWKALSGGFK